MNLEEFQRLENRHLESMKIICGRMIFVIQVARKALNRMDFIQVIKAFNIHQKLKAQLTREKERFATELRDKILNKPEKQFIFEQNYN